MPRAFSARDVLIPAGAVFVLLVLGRGLMIAVAVMSSAVAGCGPDNAAGCNFALGDVSLRVVPVAVVVSIVATVVLGVVFRRQGRSAWLAPVLGVALLLACGIAAVVMSYIATA
jgi:hypothetical protein